MNEMETYISILRGINVSGHKVIKMKALQEMYEKAGFKHVKTYIQSGNVVFAHAPAEPGVLGKLIQGEILKTFGFEVPVLVLRKEELKGVSEHNQYILEQGEDISKLHVTFLSGEASVRLLETIRKEDYLPDEFYIFGQAVYLFCPNGYGNTKLSNTFFEKKLHVQATTRNWKTVVELVNMSEEISGL